MAAIKYPSTPASISLRHHQTNMEASRSANAGRRQSEETLADVQASLERIVRLYNYGKPLFPRRLLKDLHEQISKGYERVSIPDWDDQPHTYSLKVPENCTKESDTYVINYSSIQRLTYFNPQLPKLLLEPPCPISIGYTRSPSHPGITLKEIHDAFKQIRRGWQDSETCSNLEGSFVQPRFWSSTITRIVAFGLGTLGKAEFGNVSVRSYAQHAAMLTMATILKEARISKGQDVQCFAQDPWYDEKDVDFLRGLGITVVNDPEGFLMIDEHTLVFSVCPNIPVRQIVADVQWPAAIVWNSPLPEGQMNEWKSRLGNGEVFWTGPMMTDPDSERVCEMLRDYDGARLVDHGDYFGDLTVYARRVRS
ncbi:hypothetical protein AnigIFM50267_003150 [Aspergillus niger]|nr:hypothetical protein AnigIFM50267_003150 [Aspergillus niger]